MKPSIFASSILTCLLACGGGGGEKTLTTSSSSGGENQAAASGVDVPSSWRGEMFNASACDGEKGKITLTSTALSYYDSCYSSDPTSITGLKVTEGDGKLTVNGGSYEYYGSDYACTGAIEKLGDTTMFNLKCKHDGDSETITLKGVKENPGSPTMGAADGAVPGSKGGPSLEAAAEAPSMEMGDEWDEFEDELDQALEEAAEELGAAFEELGNALEDLDW